MPNSATRPTFVAHDLQKVVDVCAFLNVVGQMEVNIVQLVRSLLGSFRHEYGRTLNRLDQADCDYDAYANKQALPEVGLLRVHIEGLQKEPKLQPSSSRTYFHPTDAGE